MRVTGPIILGVIGAILYFAVDVEVSGVSIATIGIIMLVAAAIWFVVELVSGATGNRTQQKETVQRSDGTVEQRTRETRHNDEL